MPRDGEHDDRLAVGRELEDLVPWCGGADHGYRRPRGSITAVLNGDINLRTGTGSVSGPFTLVTSDVTWTGTFRGDASGSGTFIAQGTDGTRALRVYFSYVTLATLGYGDYTPAGTLGHLLAVVEALAGQLYLVTVVAVLVSRLSHRDRRGDRRPLIPPG